MSKLRAIVAFSAITAAGGYVAYRYVLSDADRASINSAVDTAKALANEVAARVRPLVQAAKVPQDTSNRDETVRQWTEIGF